jgi:hypothetical protein
MKRILGTRRDEETGEWRKPHNGELNDLYSSPNIVRVIKQIRIRWAGHVACVEEKGGAYRVLVRNLKGKGPLGRPNHKWEDNIKMDHQDVGWGMYWIDLAQNKDRCRAYVKAVIYFRIS